MPQPAYAGVVYCYDSAREVVTRTREANCKGEVVEAERAEEIKRKREEALKSRVKNPIPLEENDAKGFGTAFFISPNLLATNSHVIQDCRRILIERANANPQWARVEKISPRHDLAILAVPQGSTTYMGVRKNVLKRPGMNLVISGYPTRHLPPRFPETTTGKLLDLHALSNGFMRFKGAVLGGSSGSPVLSEYGELIGVVVAKVDTAKTYAQTGQLIHELAFLIPVKALHNLVGTTAAIEEMKPTQKALPIQKVRQRSREVVARVACIR